MTEPTSTHAQQRARVWLTDRQRWATLLWVNTKRPDRCKVILEGGGVVYAPLETIKLMEVVQ